MATLVDLFSLFGCQDFVERSQLRQDRHPIERLYNRPCGWIQNLGKDEADHGCLGGFVRGRMELANSSFNFTGSGGICFITSGVSFKLKLHRR